MVRVLSFPVFLLRLAPRRRGKEGIDAERVVAVFD
jgi:hypothetical protein